MYICGTVSCNHFKNQLYLTFSELSQTESRETESLPNQTSHLSAQTKNINLKAKNRTQKPAPTPKRKKKMVQSVPLPTLPEGCEDLTIADIGDTGIEEFIDKTKHKPDHVQRELVQLRRKLKNRVRELV